MTESTAVTVPDADRIDADIAALETGARLWTVLTIAQRARLLDRLHETVGAVATEWADVAATSKQLGPQHPLRGEEWLTGPYATLGALEAARETLEKLAAGRTPLDGPESTRVSRPDLEHVFG